jgi:hypothetical protein
MPDVDSIDVGDVVAEEGRRGAAQGAGADHTPCLRARTRSTAGVSGSR